MRIVLLVAALALTGALPAAGARAARTLTYTFGTRQGPTTMQPHPPPGMVGDSFESSLRLLNGALPQLGRPAHAAIGTMQFTYTIRRQCTSFERACVATADFETVTTLPGGTVTAAGKRISIARPTIVIPVVSGTGRYAGAHGTVSISPMSTKISTFHLVLS